MCLQVSVLQLKPVNTDSERTIESVRIITGYEYLFIKRAKLFETKVLLLFEQYTKKIGIRLLIKINNKNFE